MLRTRKLSGERELNPRRSRWQRDILPLNYHRVNLGARDGVQTRDLNLGKVPLCQLSYSRLNLERTMGFKPTTATLEGWNSIVELRPHIVNWNRTGLNRQPRDCRPRAPQLSYGPRKSFFQKNLTQWKF